MRRASTAARRPRLRWTGCASGAIPSSTSTATLSEAEMAGLYSACDCLVHPFRGEGFGLPVVEAMACGLPVIVTGAGPALDYATDETAFLIPATTRPVRRVPRGRHRDDRPALAVRAGRRCAG